MYIIVYVCSICGLLLCRPILGSFRFDSVRFAKIKSNQIVRSYLIYVFILRVYICKFNIFQHLRVESENTNCSTHLTTYKAHRYLSYAIIYLVSVIVCIIFLIHQILVCFRYIYLYMFVVYEICIFYVQIIYSLCIRF